MMERHFVTFCSPGTFVPEQTTKPIESWDVDTAVRMSQEIVERHNATPYAFVFTTRSRDEDDLDSTEVACSGRYFLGGLVLTLGDVKARNNPKDAILIQNMEFNRIERVLENSNSWTTVVSLEENDTVLDV